jgi:putative hydrolase of the HAD superfamily
MSDVRVGCRAVLFDLDGTLYDERGGMQRSLEITLAEAARLEAGMDTRAAAALYVEVGRPIWEEADFTRPAGAGGSRLVEIRSRVWGALLERLGVPATDGLAEHLAATYTKARASTHTLYPDSAPVLERLKGKVRLGLVSNGLSEQQREKLRACGLADLLDPVLISEEVGLKKPDPGLFLRGVELSGCEPAETLFVGDSPHRDVAGARAAGLPVAWMRRYGESYPAGQPEPDYVVDDLHPVWEILHGDIAPAGRT